MKIRIIVKSIVTAAILIAIWCMTSPALPLVVKIVLTGLFLTLYIILPILIKKSPNSAQLDKLIRDLPGKILQFLHNAGCAIMHATKLVVGWVYEVNIYAVESKCGQIYSAVCNSSHDNPDYAQRIRPLRRVARRLDLTAVCSCTAMSFAGGIFCHYGNRPALIALVCITILSILIFGAITDSSTTFFLGDTPMSADPWIGAAAKVVQIIMVVLQTFNANTNDNVTPNPAYEPFFTVQIGSFSLGISPLWMVVIVSTILFLIGCVSIGTALHDLVESDAPTESADPTES